MLAIAVMHEGLAVSLLLLRVLLERPRLAVAYWRSTGQTPSRCETLLEPPRETRAASGRDNGEQRTMRSDIAAVGTGQRQLDNPHLAGPAVTCRNLP
jgi:hypothetical protein